MVQQAILDSCELFITKLFPSLFPMMILSDLFLYFGLPELFCKTIGRLLTKILPISSYGLFAFFLSCFSGTPSNAYFIKNLYLQQVLTKEEASSVLSFSFFTNPLFYYTMLHSIFDENSYVILRLFFLPYFVNFLLVLTKKRQSYDIPFTPSVKENFGVYLTHSITHAMDTLLFILGTVSCFFLLNAFFNPGNLPFLSGILEVSQGLHSLALSSLSIRWKEILTIAFVSFGGLSIHLQVKGILSDTPISYKEFFIGRIKQLFLSIIFVLLV